MSEFAKIVPSLTGGVSQQPSSVRFPGQVEAADNTFLSLVDGAVKRPPTEHIAKIVDDVSPNAAFHLIERDGNDYILVATDVAPGINSLGLRIFATDGTELLIRGEDLSSPRVDVISYIGDGLDNYISNWQNPGITGQWDNSTGVDEMAISVTVEPGPLGYGTAVEMGPVIAAEPGILGQFVATHFGDDTASISIYVKKKDGLDAIFIGLRNTTTFVTIGATFDWNGTVLRTDPANPVSTGVSQVEDAGGGWYRASFMMDTSDGDEVGEDAALKGEELGYVQMTVIGAASTTRDYFWGISLDFLDAGATKPKPIVRQFGPFQFLTIADTALVLNKSWKTRQIPPTGTSRALWIEGLAEVTVSDVILRLVHFRKLTTYSW